MSERARERVGSVLRDKWRIEGLLGVGGMAAVYTAVHTNNGRKVAIKLLHPELSLNAELRGRFLREGYVANKIQHPGAVSILDDDVTDDGAVFLVMELLEGETIEGRRQRLGGRIAAAEVMAICDQVLEVLIAAHDAGVVHRDVKPDNVFLTREGGVKLLDFGIARLRELQSRQATMTGAGAMGTPSFMPPEQARGRWELVGPRTDLWALGASMFMLVTGRCVHEAETINELLLSAMTKPAPAIATIEPGLSPPFCNLVDRALAYESEERWSDARAMQTALRMAYRAADDGPSTNRGLGGQRAAQNATGPMPIVPEPPPEAMRTGPRPPPEALLPKVAPPPPAVFAGTPSGPLPFMTPQAYPPLVPPRGVVTAGPSVAAHATAHAVAMGAAQPRKPNRAGLVVAGVSVVVFACAYGVYRLFSGADPGPAAAPTPTASVSASASATASAAASASATGSASAEAAPAPPAETAAPEASATATHAAHASPKPKWRPPAPSKDRRK